MRKANGVSHGVAVSDDGEWVLFDSRASNLTATVTDTNAASDVYLWKRSSGALTLVSHAAGAGGSAADKASSPLAMSRDGRFALFTSRAGNLLPGPVLAVGSDQLYLHDRVIGATTLVTHAATGPAQPSNGGSTFRQMSHDGRWILFDSKATDLVAGAVDGNASTDVFLFDRFTNQTRLVSHVAGSEVATAASGSQAVAMSRDALRVVFRSAAPAGSFDAGANDGNAVEDAFVYKRATGRVTLLAAGAGPRASASSFSAPAAISADGRTILLNSAATHLVAGLVDRNARVDAFVLSNAVSSTGIFQDGFGD